ncbi:VWA domain-containing protein [Paraburkholderia sp. SIMBA_054]|uniref:VWA domain-containing protein n=1 Tax=Paraburkholderia sp. SIMBA_054 TaxID=3085795 RepID=UPI00397B9F73
MSLVFNLEKATQSLKFNLQKAGVTKPSEMEVGFAMDVSESFEDEHVDGTTNALLTRLIPWGLVFDPDKKVDCFTFSDGPNHVHNVGPITPENCQNFVADKIIGKVDGWNGATDYSYVLEALLANFGWMKVIQKAGIIGRFFGQRDKEIQNGPKRRSLVIMITDGANDDKPRTSEVLRASQERKDEVYFIFIGVSNQGKRFPFLEQLGNQFSNTGFFAIDDLQKFVNLSDDELNSRLITKELITWLKS